MTQESLIDVNPMARHDDDFYPTPAWMTRALLRRVPLRVWGGLTIEPCAGDGAIVRELPPACSVVTNDLVDRPPFVSDFNLDARKPLSWETFRAQAGPIAVVLTNPPFDVAFEIIRGALEVAEVGVIMLLRLSWLEPTDERGEWLAAHPPTRQIVLPRHDFRGNGKTDSVTSAWMLWANRPWFCEPGIEVVTKAERDELKQVRPPRA